MPILIALILFFLLNKPILASEDRNIFGLHLTQTEDIHQARDVINSSGGDWGWATIVIRSDELNRGTWQNFFDNCRKYHIIPIIRIATKMENGNWTRPTFDDIDNHANFLNSLNWPTATQHVILFNEINHGAEWGGKVDIKDYAEKVIYASQKFKSLNPSFYILSAGLDLAPPEKPPSFKSAPNVYREIFLYKPEFFDYIDAIASHSYPNHGYIGTPNDHGQYSIRGFQWELSFLKSLGVKKDLPVFITETGWPHREGIAKNNRYYTADTAANFLLTAFDIWHQESQVVAVTPFIFNYPNPPFANFSWLDTEKKLYPAYEKIISKGKSKNKPPQITTYEMVDIKIPFLIFTDTDYSGEIILKNTGQSIWGEHNFCLTPQASANVSLDAVCTPNNFIFPNQTIKLHFKFKISPDTDKVNTYIGWDGVDSLPIKAITNKPAIYRPATKIQEKIVNYIKNQLIGPIFQQNW
ncbi:MAG: hypothetical protein ACOX6N_01155 [Patescibacteria group bacterium]|jgi:hypothetical protein